MKKIFQPGSPPTVTRSSTLQIGPRFLILAVVCVVAFTLLQCAKEALTIKPLMGSNIQFRSGDEYVQNGMLVLKDHARFQELLDELRESEDTQAERDSLYEKLGITAAMRDLDTNYTDHPACMKFELDLGFTSMRRVEEDELFALLNSGDQEAISIIGDPYGKTLLNQDGAIQVETRVFKFLKSGLVAVVGNEDIDVYDGLNVQDESEIVEGFNLRLGGVHGDKISEFYQVDASGNIIQSEEYVDVRVDQYTNADKEITLVNASFIEYADHTQASFKWIYSDQTYFVGKNPDRTFEDGDMVILEYGNPTNGNDTIHVYPRVCLVSGFDITHIGGTTYRFSAAISPPGPNPHYLLRWLFGDGTSAMGNVVEHTYAPGTPPSTIVTLQAIRNSGGQGQGTGWRARCQNHWVSSLRVIKEIKMRTDRSFRLALSDGGLIVLFG